MDKSIEQLGEDFSNFNPIEDDGLLRVIQNYGNQLAQQMRINLRKNKTNASSTLDGSISPIVKPKQGGFNLSVEMEDYWQYVENGRAAGKMPPIKNIYQWIQEKRSMQEKIKNAKDRIQATKSLAYVIARKIGKKGTRPQPFVQPGLNQVSVDILVQRIEKWVIDSLEK